MTAHNAIEQSLHQNAIVTLHTWTRDDEDTLLVVCDDNTDRDAVHEYWGTSESGRPWRVHLHHACGQCGNPADLFDADGWFCFACGEPRTEDD